MCSLLTLTLRAAGLQGCWPTTQQPRPFPPAQLHTGPGSAGAADRAALAASGAAAQRKHLKEQMLRWRHRGYCPDRVLKHAVF